MSERLLLCVVALVDSPKRVPKERDATARSILSPDEPTDLEPLEIEGSSEGLRKRFRSTEPAIHLERSASRKLGDVERQSPVEERMELPVLVVAQAVGTRDVAFSDVSRLLKLGSQLLEDAPKDSVQYGGVREMRRVSRTILKSIGNEDSPSHALICCERLKADVQLARAHVELKRGSGAE